VPEHTSLASSTYPVACQRSNAICSQQTTGEGLRSPNSKDACPRLPPGLQLTRCFDCLNEVICTSGNSVAVPRQLANLLALQSVTSIINSHFSYLL
jgi:hypothetical protein